MIWRFGKETKREIEEASGAIKKLVEEISEKHVKREPDSDCPVYHVPCPLKKKNGKA